MWCIDSTLTLWLRGLSENMSGRDFGTRSCSAIIKPTQLQETFSYVSEIKQSGSSVFSFLKSRIWQTNMSVEKLFLKLLFVSTINHRQNRLCKNIHDFPVLLVTSFTLTCKCALCRDQNPQSNKFHMVCKHKKPSYSQLSFIHPSKTLGFLRAYPKDSCTSRGSLFMSDV